MEDICNLLFELSNEDRLMILLELKKEAMKLSTISNRYYLKSSESHRHLSRLREAKLIERDADGFFRLTPFGLQSLEWVPGYSFLTKQRDYFTNHVTSHIPRRFSTRIGELMDCTFTNDVMVTFLDIKVMMRNADEHIWIISDQMIADTYPIARGVLERGVELKVIRPKGWNLAPGFKENIDEKDFLALWKSLREGQFHQRELEKMPVFLYMSEKEVAAVSFPDEDGKFDYLAFMSTSSESLTWCEDIFQYYWENSDQAPLVYTGT